MSECRRKERRRDFGTGGGSARLHLSFIVRKKKPGVELGKRKEDLKGLLLLPTMHLSCALKLPSSVCLIALVHVLRTVQSTFDLGKEKPWPNSNLLSTVNTQILSLLQKGSVETKKLLNYKNA